MKYDTATTSLGDAVESKEVQEINICDCEYKAHCHYGRQYLQDLFRSRDPNRTKYDCDFHGMIKTKLEKAVKQDEKLANRSHKHR